MTEEEFNEYVERIISQLDSCLAALNDLQSESNDACVLSDAITHVENAIYEIGQAEYEEILEYQRGK